MGGVSRLLVERQYWCNIECNKPSGLAGRHKQKGSRRRRQPDRPGMAETIRAMLKMNAYVVLRWRCRLAISRAWINFSGNQFAALRCAQFLPQRLWCIFCEERVRNCRRKRCKQNCRDGNPADELGANKPNMAALGHGNHVICNRLCAQPPAALLVPGNIIRQAMDSAQTNQAHEQPHTIGNQGKGKDAGRPDQHQPAQPFQPTIWTGLFSHQ